jgi:hypothetical protein
MVFYLLFLFVFFSILSSTIGWFKVGLHNIFFNFFPWGNFILMTWVTSLVGWELFFVSFFFYFLLSYSGLMTIIADFLG